MSDRESEAIECLTNWFAERADGEWEHSHGVRIATLDNPGWSLDIDLTDTPWAALTRSAEMLERSDSDWIYTEVSGGFFRARCGLRNLKEAIGIFCHLVKSTGTWTSGGAPPS